MITRTRLGQLIKKLPLILTVLTTSSLHTSVDAMMSQDIDREYPGTSTKGLNCDLSFTKTLVNEITQSYQRYGDETIEIST